MAPRLAAAYVVMERAEAAEGSRRELPETITVGRVLRPHGVRGEVVVELLSDVPGRLDPGSELIAVRQGERPSRLAVAASRWHKSGALVRFQGIADRDAAEALREVWLEVERERVPAAPEGTFYHWQLLGCRCFDGGRELGEVVEILEDGGGLLLVVDDGERRVPVPFVGRFLQEVDVARGRIELALPEGLLETCASRS